MIRDQLAKIDDMLYSKYRMTAESVAARRIDDKIIDETTRARLGKRS